MSTVLSSSNIMNTSFDKENSPMNSPMKASPMKASPMKASPMKSSPMKASPLKAVAQKPIVNQMECIKPIVNSSQYWVNEEVDAIITWKNPKVSGSIFGAGVMFYTIFHIYQITLLSMMSYTAFLSLAASFAVINGLRLREKYMGKPMPKSFPGAELSIPENIIDGIASSVIASCNDIISTFKTIAFCDNNIVTAKAIGALYAVSYLGATFDFITIAFAAFTAAFTVPPAWEHEGIREQATIYAAKAKEMANDAISKAKAQIQGHMKKKD